MKLVSLLLWSALLAGCAGLAGQRSAELDEGRLARLEAAVHKDVAGGRIPGVVMAVARDGKVVMHKAIGQQDPAKGLAMRSDSIFRIYSMTKPIVSVAA